MAGEFKQCPNGHYYQGVSCPYCKTSSGNAGNKAAKTEAFVDNDYINNPMPTEMRYDDGETRSTVLDGQEPFGNDFGRNVSSANSTIFSYEEEIEISPTGQRIEKKVYRNNRKLVGWLVTYSFDAMGIDYKLYEGRNIIGRDMDCDVTVNDGMMSGKHATLLFRVNKYSITDNQSSHGTFVNDVDIELAPLYLKDGDMIRMGETIFKFRTSL